MSARPKTSDKGIRAVAWRLLEEGGVENVSMQAVAGAVGVQAPSLYKRFASRSDLLNAVTRDALGELKAAVEMALVPNSTYKSLEGMAVAYRAFAKRNPRAYGLIFAESSPTEEDLNARLASAAAMLQTLRNAVGDERSLPAARTLVSFLHGFVSMEIGGLFRFGGDVDGAFQFGLRLILDALI